jgi:WD repeat and SOF domain-containing protein 1
VSFLRIAGADNDRLNIYRARYLPKPIHKANQLKRTMLEARRVKEERRRKHTRVGESKPKAEKKTVVVREQS